MAIKRFTVLACVALFLQGLCITSYAWYFPQLRLNDYLSFQLLRYIHNDGYQRYLFDQGRSSSSSATAGTLLSHKLFLAVVLGSCDAATLQAQQKGIAARFSQAWDEGGISDDDLYDLFKQLVSCGCVAALSSIIKEHLSATDVISLVYKALGQSDGELYEALIGASNTNLCAAKSYEQVSELEPMDFDCLKNFLRYNRSSLQVKKYLPSWESIEPQIVDGESLEKRIAYLFKATFIDEAKWYLKEVNGLVKAVIGVSLFGEHAAIQCLVSDAVVSEDQRMDDPLKEALVTHAIEQARKSGAKKIFAKPVVADLVEQRAYLAQGFKPCVYLPGESCVKLFLDL